MKGWRPSALSIGLETGSGSLAGEFLAGHRIDRPVFFRGSPGSRSRDPDSLFALIGSAAAESGKRRRASAIMKRRQPFTSRKRPEELEMKTKKTTHERRRTGGADAARSLIHGGKGRKK
jgi:hypothetical protein